ncbi:hypothetical protein OG900_09940 [Streptomyces sp. NBC_00433]
MNPPVPSDPAPARAARHRGAWESATDALAGAGTCPDCGQDLAHCAFDSATDNLLRLLEAVGPGSHHIVCSLPSGDGPLLAAVHVQTDTDGTLCLDDDDALVLCTVMAAGTATGRAGGVVLRTTHDDERPEVVRGWSLRDGTLHPLSESEVFNAYCTDPITGDRVPPEPGVSYRAGIPLPPPAAAPAPPRLTEPQKTALRAIASGGVTMYESGRNGPLRISAGAGVRITMPTYDRLVSLGLVNRDTSTGFYGGQKLYATDAGRMALPALDATAPSRPSAPTPSPGARHR